MQVDADIVRRQGDIVICLQLHPVGGFIVKVPGKAYSGVGGNGALAEDDFVDASRRDLNSACKLVLAQVSGLQKLRMQGFSGVVPCHV